MYLILLSANTICFLLSSDWGSKALKCFKTFVHPTFKVNGLKTRLYIPHPKERVKHKHFLPRVTNPEPNRLPFKTFKLALLWLATFQS